MDVSLRTSGDVAIVEVSGRFDTFGAPAVRDHLEGHGPAAKIVVNLVGASFIDTTGLATLVTGMKRCRQGGGDLRLCGLAQPVRIIFELTRLDQAFGIFPDESAAVGSFTG